MKNTVQRFKALGDETRLRILALLMRGELCVCDLMAVLELPQSTVSRHLSYLKNSGWLDGRRQGVWMYYRLAPQGENMDRELLAVLAKGMDAAPVAQADAAKLTRHLATKCPNACS